MAYEYDELHRLTGETVTGDPDGANGYSSWTYDAVRNRQVQSSTLPGVAVRNYSHDVNDRLDAHNYDEQGQTLQDETGATYTWNFQNRLESKTGGSQGGDVSLVYNGDGQLVERTVDGVTTQFLVDDLNPTGYSQILEEIVNGTVTVIYTYGHDLISQDRLSHLGPSWHVSFYGYDGHGSVRFLTDETGVLTDTYTYDAWGQHLTTTGTTPNPYRYAGERWLESLGLSYNRARMLSTTHGRFWSMDEWEGNAGQPVKLNKYLYADGGPVMGADPTGFFTVTELNTTNGIITQLSELQADFGFALYDQIETGKGFESWAIARASPLALGLAFRVGGKVVDYSWGFGKRSISRMAKYVTGGIGRLRRISDLAGRPVNLHRYLSGFLDTTNTGATSNHLFQASLAGQVGIKNVGDLLAISLEGLPNQYKSEHWTFHRYLDDWWAEYKKGGSKYPMRPTVNQYANKVSDILDEHILYNRLAADEIAEAMLDNLQKLGVPKNRRLQPPNPTGVKKGPERL